MRHAAKLLCYYPLDKIRIFFNNLMFAVFIFYILMYKILNAIIYIAPIYSDYNVSFSKNTIIIMTSNMGSHIIQDNFEKVTEKNVDSITEKTKVEVMNV